MVDHGKKIPSRKFGGCSMMVHEWWDLEQYLALLTSNYQKCVAFSVNPVGGIKSYNCTTTGVHHHEKK